MTKIVLLPAVALGMWAAAPESLEAVGDGKADATPAIQRAIDSGAGGVTLPPGRYRITRPLVVRLDRVGPVAIRGEGGARLIMEGAGPAISITGTHVKGTAAPESFRPGVWERERMPLLDGFEIVGAHAEAVGVQVDGTMQATLARLLIRKARHGIRLTGRNRNIIISDCHIYENRGAGVLLEKLNLHQINITGSHISYNGGGGVVVRESEIRNIHIGTCDIESNMAADGPPTANVLFDARAGTIREGAIVGCTIQHNHQAPDSANIRFLGHSAGDPMRVGFIAISSNALSDVAVNIHLKHARGVTIAGNVFWKGYRHNVLVEGSSRIVMGPNLFDRSPAYGATDSRDALEFTDTTDSTITGVHIEDVAEAAAALTLRRCRRVNITGATVLRGATAGILLEDVEGVRVSDCILESLRPGPRIPPGAAAHRRPGQHDSPQSLRRRAGDRGRHGRGGGQPGRALRALQPATRRRQSSSIFCNSATSVGFPALQLRCSPGSSARLESQTLSVTRSPGTLGGLRISFHGPRRTADCLP